MNDLKTVRDALEKISIAMSKEIAPVEKLSDLYDCTAIPTDGDFKNELHRLAYKSAAFLVNNHKEIEAFYQFAPYIKQALATLDRMIETPAPQGWRLVPIEPTEEMQDAIWLASQLQDANAQYRAMIKSAPTPAPKHGGE